MWCRRCGCAATPSGSARGSVERPEAGGPAPPSGWPRASMNGLEGAAVEAVHLVGARGEPFATAESLTGGLVAATVVAIPGVSAVFRGGLVVYATDLKATLAGVPEDLL